MIFFPPFIKPFVFGLLIP